MQDGSAGYTFVEPPYGSTERALKVGAGVGIGQQGLRTTIRLYRESTERNAQAVEAEGLGRNHHTALQREH